MRFWENNCRSSVMRCKWWQSSHETACTALEQNRGDQPSFMKLQGFSWERERKRKVSIVLLRTSYVPLVLFRIGFLLVPACTLDNPILVIEGASCAASVNHLAKVGTAKKPILLYPAIQPIGYHREGIGHLCMTNYQSLFQPFPSDLFHEPPPTSINTVSPTSLTSLFINYTATQLASSTSQQPH